VVVEAGAAMQQDQRIAGPHLADVERDAVLELDEALRRISH
jgi:hypothetical protein